MKGLGYGVVARIGNWALEDLGTIPDAQKAANKGYLFSLHLNEPREAERFRKD